MPNLAADMPTGASSPNLAHTIGRDCEAREVGTGSLTFIVTVDVAYRNALARCLSEVPGAAISTIMGQAVPSMHPGTDALPARMAQILALILNGLSNKEIGRLLGISHLTVRNHVGRLLHRYGARNRLELVAMLDGTSARR